MDETLNMYVFPMFTYIQGKSIYNYDAIFVMNYQAWFYSTWAGLVFSSLGFQSTFSIT